MYRFKKEEVIKPEFLTKLIADFKKNYIPRFEKDQDYYKVKTKIEKRKAEDGKPCNRLAHGFCRYISNMATSYFIGRPVQYLVDDEEYKDALQDVFLQNYLSDINFETSKEASKKGIGFMILFINEHSKLRIKKLDAQEIIPVYSPDLDEFLEAAVRIWSVYDLEGKLQCEYADVYDEDWIYHFQKSSCEMCYRAVPGNEKECHMLSDIPVIVVWNNEDRLGDFEPHISLNDAYDNAQSDSADDMDYFTDAYLCIRGASEIVEESATGEEKDQTSAAANSLRKNKILFLDEDGQAQFLIKQVNDAAAENYKSRLYKDIFFLSQVPAISDESFAGNLSGIAIKYKLIGLEELAIMKENKFRSAQTKLLRIVTDYLNLIRNKSWDADMVKQKYERNFIENVADIIDNVKNLENIVSKQTQLKMLPAEIVDDESEELNRIRQEILDEENLPLAQTELI